MKTSLEIFSAPGVCGTDRVIRGHPMGREEASEQGHVFVLGKLSQDCVFTAFAYSELEEQSSAISSISI